MNKILVFDMDGTIADFYGVEGWLEDLKNYSTRPYEIAQPVYETTMLNNLINTLKINGWKIVIVSWLSKCGSTAYNTEVTAVKLAWLEKHLPSVEWDEVKIVNYGTPKSTVVDCDGWLFDDEERNREEWGENSFDVNDILGTLRKFF